MLEFPLIYSDTKLSKYNTRDKVKSSARFLGFATYFIDKYRDYYNVDNKFKYFKREILGLKKHKAGNCNEIADATYVALKLNGYEDVKPLWMYAYKPNEKVMRDLDHVVVGINFRTPENYKYKNGDPIFMNSKYKVEPQNDSIIVDSWGGFSEYAKNMNGKYDRRDLLLGLTNDKKKKTLLKEGEKLCFVPVEKEFRVPDELLPDLRSFFPQLCLSEKLGAKNPEELGLELEGSGVKASDIKRLKKKFRLKSSNSKPNVVEQIKEKFVDIYNSVIFKSQ